MWNEPSTYTALSASDTFHSSGTGGALAGAAGTTASGACECAAVAKARMPVNSRRRTARMRILRSGMRRFGIGLFAGGNGQVEAVFGRRQRTGGERSERARRIVAAVEVEHHASLRVGLAGIEEAAGAVAAAAVGAIGEHQEQLAVAFVQRFQAPGPAAMREFDDAWIRGVVDAAGDVGDWDGLARGMRQEARCNAPLRRRRPVVEADEAGAGFGVGMLDPQRMAIAALDHHGNTLALVEADRAR